MYEIVVSCVLVVAALFIYLNQRKSKKEKGGNFPKSNTEIVYSAKEFAKKEKLGD